MFIDFTSPYFKNQLLLNARTEGTPKQLISEYKNNFFKVFFVQGFDARGRTNVLQFVMMCVVFAIVIIQMLSGNRLLIVEFQALPCIC